MFWRIVFPEFKPFYPQHWPATAEPPPFRKQEGERRSKPEPPLYRCLLPFTAHVAAPAIIDGGNLPTGTEFGTWGLGRVWKGREEKIGLVTLPKLNKYKETTKNHLDELPFGFGLEQNGSIHKCFGSALVFCFLLNYDTIRAGLFTSFNVFFFWYLSFLIISVPKTDCKANRVLVLTSQGEGEWDVAVVLRYVRLLMFSLKTAFMLNRIIYLIITHNRTQSNLLIPNIYNKKTQTTEINEIKYWWLLKEDNLHGLPHQTS